MSGAVFLDRDGVIIENREDFVKSWNEVEFIANAFDAIHRLTDAGLPIVMITNQSAVGRGIITSEFVHWVHDEIQTEITKRDGRFSGVYFCPHSPDAGCDCRKPAPGMLIRAALDLGIDLTASFMVGDSLTDMEAASAVGACGILVLTGKGRSEAARLHEYVGKGGIQPIIAADIGEAAEIILERARA